MFNSKIKIASIVIGVLLVAVLIPVVGMAISPTRDLLLGLAPEEAVLKLADEIDVTRNSVEENSQKILELQATIDTQNVDIQGYQNKITDLQASVNTLPNKESVQKTVENAIATNEKNEDVLVCQRDIASLEKAIKGNEDEKDDCSDKYKGDPSRDALVKVCKDGEDSQIKSLKKKLEEKKSQCT